MCMLVNPHQKCGCSDSPFAKIHYFYTARSRNGLEGGRKCCVQRQGRIKMDQFRTKITKIKVSAKS